MSNTTKQYIARAIICHLDGNMEMYHELVQKAMEEYRAYKHLLVPIGEMARVRRMGA